MRWLFLIMLVLNLSYIAWEMLNTSKQDARLSVSPLPDVPTIVLVNEVVGIEDLSVVATVKDEVLAQQANTVISDSDREAEKMLSGALDAGLIVDQAELLAEVSPEPPIEPITIGQTQVSLADRRNEGGGQKKDEAQIAVPDACFTLGPFRELDTLRALTRHIKEYVAEVGFRSRDEKEPSLFWVYLPPLEDRAQAKEIGRQLKAKKIKDFYIIRSNEKENGISLGQFRNKSGAYWLAKKVRKLGFTVEVEPMFKTYTLYWLDYRLIAGNSIPEMITAEYLTDKISRLSRSCEQLPGDVL